ncbi:hypothetical protein CDD82_6060 [Ophiocordyceps australis]|uniref:Rhodanese domain-containing protein n=1 Tax=Ophiocordyceps australis TaxID=1399860 RepID=A0A2C5YY15_9HYPO|nr:hypothetical protein CDD82_6060 [Ophiocordyceps australis]
MALHNTLNVYSGPHAVKDYFDPDCHPPLPLVEIPDCLNPYRQDGVRIYAKMMSMHPATNIKVMPAMNLLHGSVTPGKTKTIVESSSGSTVISMAMVARAFHGINDVHAYLSNKTSHSKLRLLQFFGLNVTLFGGPAQPTPTDERGGIRAAARKAAESDSICSPNQYENDNNWKAHVRWTGPQIHRQLPNISAIAASMGTMTGLGTYFNKAKPSVFRIAVCTNAGDRVPGPREFSLMSDVKFPYMEAADVLEEVGSRDSYALSLNLTRQGLVCGPSSGFTLKGLLQALDKRKRHGTLSQLADPSGDINCVFICCDLPYQYLNDYFDKLGPENFTPLGNERLKNVDLYCYQEAWERGAVDALSSFFNLQPTQGLDTLLSLAASGKDELCKVFSAMPNTQILDFRRAADFDAIHLPNSVNVPLQVLKRGRASHSPFADPVGDCTMLEELWLELESLFSATDADGKRNPSAQLLMAMLRGKRVLTLCYDGDCSRVANSVLRAKGIASDSVRGGFAALKDIELPSSGSSHHSGRFVSVEA